MKKLLFISILFLSGCDFARAILTHNILGPKFAVGDCIASQSDVKRYKEEKLESWQSTKEPVRAYKILEVGHDKYRTKYYYYEFSRYFESPHDMQYDFIYEKVECPVELKDLK